MNKIAYCALGLEVQQKHNPPGTPVTVRGQPVAIRHALGSISFSVATTHLRLKIASRTPHTRRSLLGRQANQAAAVCLALGRQHVVAATWPIGERIHTIILCLSTWSIRSAHHTAQIGGRIAPSVRHGAFRGLSSPFIFYSSYSNAGSRLKIMMSFV